MFGGFARLPFLPHHRVSGITALFISSTLHSFALSLTGIFIPLYVLQITGSLGAVFLFFALYALAIVLSELPGGQVVEHFGFRRSGLAGSFFYILSALLLLFSARQPGLLWPAAVAMGVACPLYWLPYHLIFAEDGKSGSFGKKVSALNILSLLASASGPLIGGLIIAFFGFKALYFATIIFLLLSVLPFSVMQHHPLHKAPTLRTLLAYFNDSKNRYWKLSFSLSHFESLVMDNLWPVFVYLIFRSYETLGSVASATLLFSLLILAVGGALADRFEKRKVLTGGAWATFFGWLLLPFTLTPGGVFLSSTFLKGARVFFTVPFDALFYTKVAHERTDQALTFLIFREISLHATGFIFMVFLWLLSLFNFPWTVIFILAGVLVLLANHYLQKIVIS